MSRCVSIGSSVKRPLLVVVIALVTGFASLLDAQSLPPRPIVVTVNNSRPLAFGAFTPGASGGTVTISAAGGTRSSTGTVILLNMSILYSPAMFYVRGNPGTLVSLLTGPTTIITGSNGGSLSLQANNTYPASPFVISVPFQQETTILIGGSLTMGNIALNPAGSYTGTIDVTFVQE